MTQRDSAIIDDRDLLILEHIHSSGVELHQRDLAKIVGLSLGMTNSILKRLAQKGLLTIKKVNNRNVRYIVSPEGVETIAKRSYRYFRRTISFVVDYRKKIEQLVLDAKERGFDSVILLGSSDLDFIVEHSCSRFGLQYLREGKQDCGRPFILYSESYIPDSEVLRQNGGEGVVFLQDILHMVTSGPHHE